MTVAPETDAQTSRQPFEGETPQVRAWVRAAQAGDRAAFDALVSLYFRTVFRTALAALQRAEDAEDVAQDAFVLAWRKVADFRGDSTFKTWLLTITWRQALDRRKSRDRWWRRRVNPAEDAADDGLDRIASETADPERVATARAQAAALRIAIASLTPKLRDTLLLAAAGEHTYDEIGIMLGVPTGTVKWRVAEARRILTRSAAGSGGRERL